MADYGSWFTLAFVIIVILAIVTIPWLTSVCHEMGHALAAIALGVPLKSIVIGKVIRNSKTITFRIMELPVVIGGKADGGTTFYKGYINDWRKLLSVSMAGPLASYAAGLGSIIAGKILLSNPVGSISFAGLAIVFFGLTNMVAVLSSSIPNKDSDGSKVLESLLIGFQIKKRRAKARLKTLAILACAVWTIFSLFLISRILQSS